MKSLTIGKRITFGFAIILTMFAVGAVTSTFLLKQIKGHQDEVIHNALPGVTEAGQIKFLTSETQLRVLRHTIAKTPEEKKAVEAELSSLSNRITKAMDNYEKTITRSEDRDQFNRIKAARAAYIKVRSQVLHLSRDGKGVEAQELNDATLRPLHDVYLKECDGLLEENSQFGTVAADASEKAMGLANILTVTLTIAGIAIGLIISMVIIKGVKGILINVAGTLSDGSHQVSAASSQVSSASQTLADGSSQQASSLEESSASLEEMAAMTKRNAENARKAHELTKEARMAADKGVGDMQTMANAMNAIKVSSDGIAKIIKTIDEIAFQTNILALNAAVEGARAGEAGMGFAVVADEVRNLSQRCAEAAKETAGKIEGAIVKTGQGVEISSKVATVLNEIVSKVRQVDELVTEVAGASSEQTDGIAQINVAVSQVDKVTQSNAATAEESAAAAQELNAQAEVMKQSVAELLQLVGGKTETATEKSVAQVSQTNKSRRAHYRQNGSHRQSAARAISKDTRQLHR